MLATACSATLLGLSAELVRVEVELSCGVPSFELVGLAEASVRESRVRVRAALAQVGVELGEYRVVVNLAPADLRKMGSGFDLAIAAAVLAASGNVPMPSLAGVLFLGELSLSGKVQPLRGLLPRLLGARDRGVREAVVPKANAAEAALVRGLRVRVAASLAELQQALAGRTELPLAEQTNEEGEPRDVDVGEADDDLADVRGQQAGKRALEIAAAGGHNLLFLGPPGAGKTMLARRLPGLLPALREEEALETLAVASVAGQLASKARTGSRLRALRPFRAPHHTVSEIALVGGGDPPRPGEVSLAHHGVLFLDELPEFRRSALEALRQPLEDGHVTVSRAQFKTTFYAEPLVVAAMNPCPCGYRGDSSGRCRCSGERVRVYQGKLSGPLLDRLDLHVVLPPVDVACLRGDRGESTREVRTRVLAARARQSARVEQGLVQATTNARLSSRELERVAQLDAPSEALLVRAAKQMGLSARAYGKVLRVARTLADLQGQVHIALPHVAEAVALRVLDRSASPAPRAA